jgi:hypothetical protein
MAKSLRFSLICLGVCLSALVGTFLLTRPYTAGARPVGPFTEPEWGTDVRVNPIISGTREMFKNYTMAINPANPNMLLGGYDYASPSLWSLGYAVSTNTGISWTNGLFGGIWGEDMIPQYNSSVAFSSQGLAYYLGQASSSTHSGYFVLTSTTGLAWSTPVPVISADYSEYRDQVQLAIDKRTSGPNAGSIYALWRFFRTDYQGLLLKYSRNGGSTWSNEIQVTDPGNERVFGPMLVAASTGKLYVAFQELPGACWCNTPSLFLDSSTDGGVTWGTDRLITGRPISSTGALDLKGRELILLGDDHGGDVRINHFPSIAIAPNNPDTVYVAWNDGRWDTTFHYFVNEGRHGDIAFSRTTDAGLTWSAPIRLNDDPLANGVDQWKPNLAVASDGTLQAVWYDRRVDPNGFLYDLFFSQSTDGGLTWSQNQRISDASSDPVAVTDYKGVGDIGNYNGLVVGPDYILPSWSDTRRQFSLDFYIDRGQLHNSPTVTPILSPTRTPTRTITATATRTGTGAVTRTATYTPTSIVTATHTPTSIVTATATNTTVAGATDTPTPSATSTATACAIVFSDVNPSDYFYTPVMYLACHGIISGYADGTFRPFNNTTRAQLSKIIVLAEGWQLDCPQPGHFSDVPPENPFFCYIETAYSHLIISGYADGTFRWGNNVTRGQLSKIVVLAEGWADDCPQPGHFSDVPPTDTFFCYVETAFNHGIISGYADGTFRPGNSATRGQISKIVYQAITAP